MPKTILAALLVAFLFSADMCQAGISCISCPGIIPIDITVDADLNTSGCQLETEEMCFLSIRVDYTNSNKSFGTFVGTNEAQLLLTNGEPQVSESIAIWFNEERVQRTAQAVCFSRSSCGLDEINRLYRQKIRTFDYQALQQNLTARLYSPTGHSSTLTCVDPAGVTVSCPDGFCRAAFDGNGLYTYSSCVKKGAVDTQYGLTVSRSVLNEMGGDQSGVMYACNKPRCNSRENAWAVLRTLIAADVFPEPSVTTPIPPRGTATQLMSKQVYGPVVAFLTLLAVWRFEK